jgi:hypothetical protein
LGCVRYFSVAVRVVRASFFSLFAEASVAARGCGFWKMILFVVLNACYHLRKISITFSWWMRTLCLLLGVGKGIGY